MKKERERKNDLDEDIKAHIVDMQSRGSNFYPKMRIPVSLFISSNFHFNFFQRAYCFSFRVEIKRKKKKRDEEEAGDPNWSVALNEPRPLTSVSREDVQDKQAKPQRRLRKPAEIDIPWISSVSSFEGSSIQDSPASSASPSPLAKKASYFEDIKSWITRLRGSSH